MASLVAFPDCSWHAPGFVLLYVENRVKKASKKREVMLEAETFKMEMICEDCYEGKANQDLISGKIDKETLI